MNTEAIVGGDDGGSRARSIASWPQSGLLVAFGSALGVLLLLLTALAYWGINAAAESEASVRHTWAVLEKLQDLSLDMLAMESGARSFVLTGKQSYLDAERAARLRETQDQAAVGRLTIDNPTQQRRLPELARRGAAKTQWTERVVTLRQGQGFDAALNAIRVGPGERLMDEFQASIRELQDEERHLLKLRSATAKQRGAQAKAALLSGTIASASILGAVAWLLHRSGSRHARAERESRESGAKYRGLLEAAPDAMVVVDEAGAIVLLNLQAEKQFGYPRNELVGKQVTSIIPAGFAERLVADGTRTAAEALAQHIGTGIELVARRKDGTEFPIELMLSPLQNAEGILVTAAIRDISVRKAAETHLASMEARYRGLLEAAPDAMVVVDRAGQIVLLNVQAERQFGYRRDELLGQMVKSIIPEGFAERLVADAQRSSEDASAQHIGTGIELTGRRKDGSEFPIELMLSPLESDDGVLVTTAIRDITKRKEAEAQLIEKVAELCRSNDELGQFAYVASHDLQEPLRMVASFTQLLSRRYKGKLDSDADEFIAFAVDGASRMQRLIHDLLLYSRVGTTAQPFLDSSSEGALAQAVRNLRGAIAESKAIVTHDPLPTVMTDETQLVQLFQNLVGNAIKYQNPGVPRVHISALRSLGKKWLFSVKDNGLGIDEQYFERIFGMFQRLHKREEFAGTGVGLAICKKIVERHGGSISVESQLGKGSTFHFELTER